MIPEGLYVTLLGELQEPELYFDENDLRQGFMRRITLVFVKPSSLSEEKWQSPFDSENLYPREEIGQIAHKIVERMDRIKERKAIAILHPTVKEYLDKLSRIAYTKTIRNDGKESSLYDVALAEIVANLCVLRVIADPARDIDEKGLILVKVDDLRQVIKFMKGVRENLDEALDSIINPKEREKMRIKEVTLNEILTIIDKSGGRLGSGKLLAKLNLNKRELEPYIETLMERDDVWAVFSRKLAKKALITYARTKEKAEDSFEQRKFSSTRINVFLR